MIKSFRLGGRAFRVEVSDTPHSDTLGKAYSDLNKIMLFSKWSDRQDVPASTMRQVLAHEVTHCILDVLGREDLSGDENFVQSFSVLLHQYQETAK